MQLTILMPCLNESRTVGKCVDDAHKFLQKNNIDGEVIVADSSSDMSADIAESHGARVISCKSKGYGARIKRGLSCSRGKYIIVADCDGRYDLRHLESIYKALKNGFDFVVGDRFACYIEKGTLSIRHKFGARFVSFIGRKMFHNDIQDYTCGLRGMSKESAENMDFHSDSGALVTEMVAEYEKSDYNMCQVPVFLYSKSEVIDTFTPRKWFVHLKMMFRVKHNAV